MDRTHFSTPNAYVTRPILIYGNKVMLKTDFQLSLVTAKLHLTNYCSESDSAFSGFQNGLNSFFYPKSYVTRPILIYGNKVMLKTDFQLFTCHRQVAPHKLLLGKVKTSATRVRRREVGSPSARDRGDPYYSLILQETRMAKFQGRKPTYIRYVDLTWLSEQNFSFPHDMEAQGTIQFMELKGQVYPALLGEFYANFRYKDENIGQ
ncbi:hypothetical protein Lal_00028199 [Lupinus albus]|nr:hypothetical protein Lal_00028199 [Lupinus albus]